MPSIGCFNCYFALGETPGVIAFLGITLVCAGVCFLAADNLKKHVIIALLMLAKFAAATAALYSVIHAYGVRYTDSVFSFTVHLVFWNGLVFII